jgi:alanine racemase
VCKKVVSVFVRFRAPISCLMALLYFDYDIAIQSRMLLLFPVEMRLKVKTGINNCSLIDDSYSSDFQSLKIALIS